jgi:hypothetical protein
MNRTILLGLLAAALATPFAPAALAHRGGECDDACVTEFRDCSQAAKDLKLACRETCEEQNPEEGRDLFWCQRRCTADQRADRATCRLNLTACRVDCKKPDGGDPACRGACGEAAGDCLSSATGSFVDCQFECPKGPEREACVVGCQDTLKDEASGCKSDFETCFSGCGDGSTTTSTVQTTTTTSTTTESSTTSTTLQACETSGAPTCGGSCPEPLQVCQEVEPGACACVQASVNGAFVRFGFGRRN